MNIYQNLIDRGGGVIAIGGHLILMVSDDPPPNKTHVVYMPLTGSTAEQIEWAAKNAMPLELKGIKPPPPKGPFPPLKWSALNKNELFRLAMQEFKKENLGRILDSNVIGLDCDEHDKFQVKMLDGTEREISRREINPLKEEVLELLK